MSMLNEFKTFAMRGNVIDLAVGVVIGAAFGKIVTALVDGVIMPPIGLAIGGIDFAAITIPLTDEVSIAIGAFINTVIQFIIIAFAIFLLVKAINRVKKEEPAAPAAPPADVVLLTEIRDLLKQQRGG
jgi:large conductance mechanosensitive channel